MNPKEYYYNRFRQQFTDFIHKSGAHEHRGEGIYISIQDLNKDNLSHIPQEDYMLFHCALACTILIDQVMYTHFKNDYPKFQQMTLYPKMEYGITNINCNPWAITHDGIGLTILDRFLVFYVDDLKDFFDKNQFQHTTWDKIKQAMIEDADVVGGSRGKILGRILKDK